MRGPATIQARSKTALYWSIRPLLTFFLSTPRRRRGKNWPHKARSLVQLSRSRTFSRPVSLSSVFIINYVVFGLPHYDPYCVRENKNSFRWRQTTKNKKAGKREHVVSLCVLPFFVNVVTSLRLVIHVVQNHQAREQERDALREDKQRKLMLLMCQSAMFVLCQSVPCSPTPAWHQ